MRLRSAGTGHPTVQGTRDSESSEKSGADWRTFGRGTSEPGRHPRACTVSSYAFSHWRIVDATTSFGVAYARALTRSLLSAPILLGLNHLDAGTHTIKQREREREREKTRLEKREIRLGTPCVRVVSVCSDRVRVADSRGLAD